MSTEPIIAILLATLGGMATYLHKWLSGDKFILTRLLAQIFISGFIGTLFYYLCLTIFPPGSPFIIFITAASGTIGYDRVRPILDRVLNERV